MARIDGDRREFLRRAGAALAASALPAPFAPRRAQAALPPLPAVGADALLLQPGDADFARYQPSYNKRVAKQPALRALCRTPAGVAAMVDWARSKNVPFALRSGGHSFEGLSQSEGLVIDTRLLDAISVDPAAETVTAGAGAGLGAIYKAVAAAGFAFAAGSCPLVGISGHALGGGYGLLARPFGLTADNLLGVDIVDAEGRAVGVEASTQSDLFWACRGGGGGSFGAATQFRFRIVRARQLVLFALAWTLAPEAAVRVFDAWQRSAPQAPDAITALCKLAPAGGGQVSLRVAGQSVGTLAEAARELRALTAAATPGAPPRIWATSFFGGVDYFAGGWNFQTSYSKGKSDFIASPIEAARLGEAMARLARLPRNRLVLICDAYGGAIGRQAPAATAFAHRAALYCIQYYTSWERPADGPGRLADIDGIYALLRPAASGGAYVNYADLDLSDWAGAYWGANLPRLRAIKAAVDPGNVFAHRESVAPAAGGR